MQIVSIFTFDYLKNLYVVIVVVDIVVHERFTVFSLYHTGSDILCM